MSATPSLKPTTPIPTPPPADAVAALRSESRWLALRTAAARLTTPAIMQDPASACRVPLRLRWLIQADLPEVLAIENAVWRDRPLANGPRDLVELLTQPNVIGIVAEPYFGRMEVRGFVLFRLMRKTVRLEDLCVHPFHTGKGIGRALVAKAMSRCYWYPRDWQDALVPKRSRLGLVADVDERDRESQGFLSACGMEARLVRRPKEESDVYRYCLVAPKA